MKNSIIPRVKYLWVFIILKLTAFLPDWKPLMRIRGFLLKPGFHSVGCNFQVGSYVSILNSFNITIGDNVYIANYCWLQGIGGIHLDNEVMLGPYTSVVTNIHTLKDGSFRFGKGIHKPVNIGKGSWTGSGVKIMPGVVIGETVLCGAGSVITKNMSSCSVVGGIPAHVIRRISR